MYNFFSVLISTFIEYNYYYYDTQYYFNVFLNN